MPNTGGIGRFGSPSKPPVYFSPMLAASSSSAMVQSVSISSVEPGGAQQDRPDASPISAATPAASTRLEIGSFQMP